jgi:GNAT superfamily N-acetyltransferase
MDFNRRYEAWLHRGNLQGVWGGLLGAGFAAFGLAMGFQGFPATAWIIPIFGVVGFFMGKGIGFVLLEGSGRTAQAVYAPEAAGTYAQTHSNIDAMEAKGHYRAAADAWEAVIISQPLNPWPLIRAGELYARQLNDPETAVVRFVLARDVTGVTPELQRYASQKIVDLYLGALNDPGKAQVELRRLIIAHPGTREAEFARAAIARLKADPAV